MDNHLFTQFKIKWQISVDAFLNWNALLREVYPPIFDDRRNQKYVTFIVYQKARVEIHLSLQSAWKYLKTDINFKHKEVITPQTFYIISTNELLQLSKCKLKPTFPLE